MYIVKIKVSSYYSAKFAYPNAKEAADFMTTAVESLVKGDDYVEISMKFEVEEGDGRCSNSEN